MQLGRMPVTGRTNDKDQPGRQARMANERFQDMTNDVDGSAASDCSTAPRVYKCTIHLKDKTTVVTETTDPNGFQGSLSSFMDTFYRRRLFRKVNSVVKLCGRPEVFIPIDHIHFYVIQEQSQ